MFKTKSLEHYFKPEVRNRGEDYYDEDAIYLSQATDTDIAAVIKATPPIRITLASKSISDPTFTVACSCTSSQKGQLCKHIWGTILTAALDYPDFFDSKTDLLKAEASTSTKAKREVSASQKEFQDKLKAKQSDHRKEQYQKLKSEKKSKKSSVGASHQTNYNEAAEEALKYFSENGFELSHPINIEALRSAKKLLSRVFHPDKGGSHDEALQLNKHFDVLAALQENR